MPRISPILICAVLLLGHTADADVAPTPQVELQLGVTGGFTYLESESINVLGPRIAVGRGWSIIELHAEYEHLGMYDSGPGGGEAIGTAQRLALLGQLDIFEWRRGTNSVRYFAEVGLGRQWVDGDERDLRRNDGTVGIGWDIQMKISRGSGDPMIGGLTFVGRVTAAGKRDEPAHASCAGPCSNSDRAYDLGMTGTASLTLSW
jgi:hypothetical protein